MLKINGDLITKTIDNTQNIVVSAPWACETTVGIVTASVQGVVTFDYNPTNPFIQYESLTEQEVLTWVKSALGGQAAVDFYESVALEKATFAASKPGNTTKFMFISAVYKPEQTQAAPWTLK